MKIIFIFLLFTSFLNISWGISQDDSAHVNLFPEVIVPGKNVRIEYNNPQILGHPVFIHYGFNGWNLDTNGPGAATHIDQNNLNYYAHTSMQWSEQSHRYFANIPVPLNARALHMSFCWDSCKSGQWDNNKKNDYAWPVVFPYIGPVLTWNEKTHPSSAIVISFESGVSAPAWLEYEVSGGGPSASSQTTRIFSPRGVKHRFELKGLLPDTFYNYRVGAGENLKSEIYKFKTAKKFSSLKQLSFLVFGDVQDNGENGVFARLADEMARQNKDIDFILSTGDLPWNDKPGDWWTFFDKGRLLFANHVVMPAQGNHDTPTVQSNRDHTSFVRYFDLPDINLDRVYYQFSFGPARFYALNSERPDELAEGGVQYRWLNTQLNKREFQMQQTRDELWSFAYWHIPPFNVGARHGTQQKISKAIVSLLDGIIDWQFGGHEHLYQRTKPLKMFSPQREPVIMTNYGNGQNEGVGYLVVPSSGVPASSEILSFTNYPEYRERLAFPLLDYSANSVPAMIGYTRIDINDTLINLRVFQLNEEGKAATVMDQLQYQKK